MPPDTSDVSLDEVSTELQAYGHWLRSRTDVALWADDVAPVDEHGDDCRRRGSRPPVPPRVAAGVVAAVALVVVVVVVAGFVLGDRSGGDRVEAGPAGRGGESSAIEGGDAPTSGTGSPDRPAVGTDGDRTGRTEVAHQATATEVDAGAVDAVPVPADREPATSVTTAAPSAPAADHGDDGAADDGGRQPWQAPANGATGFLAPAAGSVLDLNEANTLRVQPVPGATTYVFEGWQDGTAVMSTSVDEPALVIPSRLVATGAMAGVQAGPLRLTVTARDSAGDTLGVGETQVIVAGSAQPGGGDALGDDLFPTD